MTSLKGTTPFVFYLQTEKEIFQCMRVTNYILFTVSHGYRNISDSLPAGRHHSSPVLHYISIMTQILQEKI